MISWFVGVDISSLTLDVSVRALSTEMEIVHRRFSNDAPGFKEILTWLKSIGVHLKQSWFCMEHSGIYGLELSCFLTKKKMRYTILYR